MRSMDFLDKIFAGKTTTRAQGDAAEDLAWAHLQAAGLRLMARNYRTPGRGGGEIDLIVQEPDGTVVFVEVRRRSSQSYGGAGASIAATKQRRIILAARHYLMRWGAPPPCRFDVVLVEKSVQWIKAAFDAA